jgi:tetratricopeptide (TPR) repeat protein
LGQSAKEDAMRYPALLVLCLIALAPAVSHAARATVQEIDLEIPTYQLGPADKNPPLWDLKVYPYPRLTDITRQQASKTYRAVVLENDYIQVIVLPELGGRIYAALDKTNGDHDFIYRNHVIKPGLVALRGAWISGGIEWNFPTLGHTVHTVSPVPFKVIEGKDGSVSCVVGTTEWARRMRWTVFTTVYPDRSCFRNRVFLQNPTFTHNNAYFWANAAVHCWPETRVTFPPAEYTFAGMRRSPRSWPMFEGQDMSWYKNTPYPFDYFCGSPGDYQGAYHVERDCGTVHCASRHDALGKKFWTWGTARSGMMWEDLLTDRDGQYIEIQSGRLPTQGDTWTFEPHMSESWEEYWYPVKKMGGFVKANPDAAVNFEPKGGKLLVAVNVTRQIREATVEVLIAGQPALREAVALDPAGAWRKEIAASGPAERMQLFVRDRAGREIIRYQPGKTKAPPPELEPEFPASEAASAEELYLKGRSALKHWNPGQAESLFAAALQKDPGFSPALRELAVLRYKDGRYREALELAQKALSRNEDDESARYYRALAKIKLGLNERTEEDLDLLSRRAAYRHVAPYLLASLAAGEKNDLRAEELLRSVVRQNPADLKARTMLAAVMRHLQKAEEADRLIDGVLAEDPLNPLARIERALLGGQDRQVSLPDDPQDYLEAACDYLEMNRSEDALAALELCRAQPGVAKHPLVCFYLGHLADRLGKPEAAKQFYAEGCRLPLDYVFPFRAEDEAVLNDGLRLLGDSWQLHYYLGTLLAAKNRWQEGLKHLSAASSRSPGCAVLYGSLGAIYSEELHDRANAQAAYEKALACDPNDSDDYLALDRLYAESGSQDKREGLFQRASAKVKADFRVQLQRAEFLVGMGKFDDALHLLKKYTFHPWEGWNGGRAVYLRALHGRADRAIQEGQYDRAVEDLKQAMEYPENLGTGKPARPNDGCEFYKLGLCYQGLGKKELARECFAKAVDSPNEPSPVSADWHAKAVDALKKFP